MLGDCGKVRLSNGSDGSIGKACFPSDKELSDGEKMTSWKAGFNSIRDMCKRRAWWLWQSQIVRWIRWVHRTSVFSIGQSYPMEKKWRHEKQGLIQLEMCASGVLGDCGKVRLSDGSDGSIGQACIPSDKELSDWKTDVTTVEGRRQFDIIWHWPINL